MVSSPDVLSKGVAEPRLERSFLLLFGLTQKIIKGLLNRLSGKPLSAVITERSEESIFLVSMRQSQYGKQMLRFAQHDIVEFFSNLTKEMANRMASMDLFLPASPRLLDI